MSKFYVTTAIAYVNAAPHIGFALELIQADSLARYHRLKGDETFFLTGVDEHGVKIYETAKEAGMETQDFADMNAEKFKNLKGILNLSNDGFIRTTSAAHKSAVQEIWKKMFEKGDIYKAKYSGKYCVGCEAFIPDKDADEEGNCPIHKKPLKVVEEENYFFKLSKYSDKIRELIETDQMKVVPEARKNEMLNIIGEEGLKDVSFSRPKATLPWGVDVPNDESQVMYVWCDALSNYITGIGYGSDQENFEKFWPCDAHIIGKDILRFHAGIWIGMLLSAEIALPKSIYVHGFITSEGQKMSKSIGNVVDPVAFVQENGIDPLRYYLLREIPTTDDGDFSLTRFKNLYNSELANGLGNLLNRVVMMAERYVEGKLEKSDDAAVEEKLQKTLGEYHKAFEEFDLKRACEAIYEIVDYGNKYIDDTKPWVLEKEGEKEKLKRVLFNLYEILCLLNAMILPIIPEAAEKMAGQLGIQPGNLSLDFKFGEKDGQVQKGEPLFMRLE